MYLTSPQPSSSQTSDEKEAGRELLLPQARLLYLSLYTTPLSAFLGTLRSIDKLMFRFDLAVERSLSPNIASSVIGTNVFCSVFLYINFILAGWRAPASKAWNPSGR